MREARVSADPSVPRGLAARFYRNSALRYLFIGGLSFIIDFGILYLLHEVAGVVLWLATGAAFLASFAFNYSLQRVFSFSSRSSHGRSLAKYVALVGFNTVATIGIVALLDHFFVWQVGKVAATIVTTVWNYFAYRFIVFVDRPFEGRNNDAHVMMGQIVDDPDHTVAPTKEDTRDV